MVGRKQNFGKKLNLSRSTITLYESGKREPNIDILTKLATIFNCNMDTLISGVEPKYVTINVYGFIPAGVPLECIENIVDTEDISADMLKGDKQYFGLKIHGDSMEPEYKNNDTIILLKTNDCENGQDCVVMVNGYERHFQACF